MADKITTTFGADTADLEGGMMRAYRSMTHLERKTVELAKAQELAGSAGGMEKMSAGASKGIGLVKQLASAFGMAEAGALLVPGIGIAAVGVAGLSAAVRYVATKYEEAAEAAKSIAESEDRILRAKMSTANFGKTEAQLAKDKQMSAQAELDDLMASTRRTVTNKSTGTDGKVVERELTTKEAVRAAELNAQIEESKAALLILSSKELEESNKKSKAEKKANDEKFLAWKSAMRDKISALEEEAAFEKKSDDNKLKALESQRAMEAVKQSWDYGARLAVLELDKKIAAQKDKIAKAEQAAKDKAQKTQEDNNKMAEAAAKIRYDYIWKNATDEQKLEQARKEGAEALARYQAKASAENLLALTKARAKYLEIKDEIAGKNSAGSGASTDPLATGGRTRNEQGRLTRNGVIISEEDALRAEKTRAENLGKEGKKGESESLLKEIRDYLKPTGK
jgi:hypothetical protein